MLKNIVDRVFGPSHFTGGEREGPSASRGRNGNGVPVESALDSEQALVDELGRARRYEHAFSIVVVQALGEGAALWSSTGQALRDILRASDVVHHDPVVGRFVLGLPETRSTQARRGMARVQEAFDTRLGVTIRIGVAEFPAEGLTLDDLIAFAWRQLGPGELVLRVPQSRTLHLGGRQHRAPSSDGTAPSVEAVRSAGADS